MTDPRPVVVIGSGFAGSIVAAKLTKAGRKVLILERGPWRNTTAVRGAGIADPAPLPHGARFFTHILRRINREGLPGGGLTLNRRGMYEIFSDKHIDVACTSQVGGSSHVYGALHKRPQDSGFWDGHHDKISVAQMEGYYRSVLAELGSAPVSVDAGGPNLFAKRFANNPHFITDQRSLDIDMGLRDGLGTIATEELSGEGLLGSARGIKRTADETWLLPAMRNGLIVKDMCEVESIFRQGDGGAVSYRLDVQNYKEKKRETIVASRVILAAGTINTMKLLLASRDRFGGLDGMPRLGFGVGGNGDYSAYWRHEAGREDLSEGLPTRGMILLSNESLWQSSRPWPVIVEGAMPYSRLLPWIPFLKHFSRRGTLLAGLGPDDMSGRVFLHKGKMRIDFDPRESLIYQDIRQAFDLIEDLSGHRLTHFPKVSTVHPMGGAPLGSSPEKGVVDDAGEIYGHPGLHIADASVMPASLGAPPSLSIAAWANNVADKIISLC
ncbi:FAD-dependent oxidoreductase [Emcibacter sp.]|uniref:FAD-dependent oxidoreductase n=1 Tax=Emcibacter sp. TaxID=1979954 RepID=UPI002AA78BFE|nr:FAD-dependent oxidoreductase [Emcibacter sp.]